MSNIDTVYSFYMGYETMHSEDGANPERQHENNEDKYAEQKEEVNRIIQEGKTPSFRMELEKENQFDEVWLTGAQELGYSVIDDGAGRTLEKDGQTIKLKHHVFHPKGNRIYIAVITSPDASVKPSSFTFAFEGEISADTIKEEFTKLLYRYEHRYDPEE